jgi:hypothetical protein
VCSSDLARRLDWDDKDKEFKELVNGIYLEQHLESFDAINEVERKLAYRLGESNLTVDDSFEKIYVAVLEVPNKNENKNQVTFK